MTIKSHVLQIRLDENEYNALFRASARQAMELSTWVRLVAIQAASVVLMEDVEKLVPREPPRVQHVRNPNAGVKVGDERVKIVPRPRPLGVAHLKSTGRKVSK